MWRLMTVFGVMLALCGGAWLYGQQGTAGGVSKPLVVEIQKNKAAVKDTALVAAPGGRRDLTLRQRREMGLTLSNFVAIAKELKAEGEIDKDTTHPEIAAAIAVRMEVTNPTAFQGASAFDIQTIIDLIDRLMPLILRLIDLFSYCPAVGLDIQLAGAHSSCDFLLLAA